ncbi:MAG: class I SAM-dependent methyltransferase [Gallionella sp.]|nr:class I SAM-dependent methyltransferase [Gallionella sp.]
MENYKEALKIDKEISQACYLSSLDNKTELQKTLEELLVMRGCMPTTIADIACGGGGTSYYLSQIYPQAKFTLVDANEEAIVLARASTKHFDATCSVGNIYNLALETDGFDVVICWSTLSWLSEPEKALRELIRICKPGGRIFVSSLFNTHYDVDIYSTVKDNTRLSVAQGISITYNTYSVSTVSKWVAGLVSDVQVHEFEIPIDVKHEGRGLGTSTFKLENGKRLQISGGILMNWGILELKK